MDDFHGTTTKNVRRANDHRKADFFNNRAGFFSGMRDAVWRLLEVKFMNEFLEPLTIFGKVNRIRAGAQNRDAGRFYSCRDFKRGLTTELNNYAFDGAICHFFMNDFNDIFCR